MDPALGEFSRYAGCERRRHERIRLNWPGVLYSVVATEIVLAEDVSAGGLGIRSCADLMPGDTLRVEMHSGFRVIGRVVRARDHKIGSPTCTLSNQAIRYCGAALEWQRERPVQTAKDAALLLQRAVAAHLVLAREHIDGLDA
jgi:PilZ domain